MIAPKPNNRRKVVRDGCPEPRGMPEARDSHSPTAMENTSTAMLAIKLMAVTPTRPACAKSTPTVAPPYVKTEREDKITVESSNRWRPLKKDMNTVVKRKATNWIAVRRKARMASA